MFKNLTHPSKVGENLQTLKVRTFVASLIIVAYLNTAVLSSM